MSDLADAKECISMLQSYTKYSRRHKFVSEMYIFLPTRPRIFCKNVIKLVNPHDCLPCPAISVIIWCGGGGGGGVITYHTLGRSQGSGATVEKGKAGEGTLSAADLPC